MEPLRYACHPRLGGAFCKYSDINWLLLIQVLLHLDCHCRDWRLSTLQPIHAWSALSTRQEQALVVPASPCRLPLSSDPGQVEALPTAVRKTPYESDHHHIRYYLPTHGFPLGFTTQQCPFCQQSQPTFPAVSQVSEGFEQSDALRHPEVQRDIDAPEAGMLQRVIEECLRSKEERAEHMRRQLAELEPGVSRSTGASEGAIAGSLAQGTSSALLSNRAQELAQQSSAQVQRSPIRR